MDEDDLWSLPPEGFTAARDVLVRELRAAGRAEDAARVKALRKPTRDAWAVNLIARSEPDALLPLVDLGEQLRAAQASGDAAALRSLSARRSAVVEQVVSATQRLVGALSASALESVRATFNAAVADADAAAQVRAARLTSGLVYAGLGVAPLLAVPDRDADEQPATPSPVQPRRARLTPVPAPDPTRLESAERALRRAEDEVTATQLARAEAQEQVDQLALALDEAKQLLAEAQSEARAASRARDAAAATVERLRRRKS
jgi:hypothetical protein